MPSERSFSERSVLLLILAFALIVRVAWGLMQPRDVRALSVDLPDQHEYIAIAQNMSDGHGMFFYDTRFMQKLYAYRTPGYPLLIVACRMDLRAVRIVQAILDTSAVLAVWLIARKLLGGRAALIAPAAIAIHPFLIYFSGLILTETLFTAMLAWGMALLLYRKWTILGLTLLALCTLVRPGTMALPALLAATAAFGAAAHPIARRREVLLSVVAGVLMTAAVLGPWAWRNHRTLGKYVWTSTNAGITLYDGFNPHATGASDQMFVRSMPELLTMSEVQRSKYLRQQAISYALMHPARAVGLGVSKIFRTWSPAPLSRSFGDWRYVTVGMAVLLPLMVMIVLGLMGGAISGPAKLFLILPALYFTASAAMSVGSLRYRIPADVPMAVLAAAAVRSQRTRYAQRRAPQ